jgi:hypothetical protein
VTPEQKAEAYADKITKGYASTPREIAVAWAAGHAEGRAEAEYEFVKKVLENAEMRSANNFTLEAAFSSAFIECMAPVVEAKELRMAKAARGEG